MTATKKMTRDELLKLAALDVFGLLDPDEAALFAHSLETAPSNVRDEIIVLQASIAADDSFLPTEEPDPALRDRVLDAVARAIEDESSLLTPLASIGHNRAIAGSGVESSHSLVLGGRSMHYWRAACFVLAAGLLVTMFGYLQAVNHGNLIAQLAIQRGSDEALKDLIGPDLADFAANPNAQAMVLRPNEDDFGGGGAIYIDKIAGQVLIHAYGLTEGRSYTLRQKLADGTSKIIREFTARVGHTAFRIDDAVIAMVLNAGWEIIDSSSSQIVLATV